MEFSLEFSVKYDLELLEKNIVLPTIRLLGLVEFKHGNNWSKPYRIIIDTGSPASVFPSYIQEKCDTHLIHQTIISGLVPNEKCSLPAKLVSLTLRLSDRDKVSKPIFSKAYITTTDKIPLILGFADILERYKLVVNYPQKKASLLIPIVEICSPQEV